jgi:hypothetical protein
MKTQIEVWNPNKGTETWTLDALREANCTRRMRILSGEGLAKVAQKKVTVHDTNKTKYQLCCHYPSFKLRQMNAAQAVEIFNHDGSQVAKVIR